MKYVRDIVKLRQLIGDFGIDREFKAIKKASNSNMLLDAKW